MNKNQNKTANELTKIIVQHEQELDKKAYSTFMSLWYQLVLKETNQKIDELAKNIEKDVISGKKVNRKQIEEAGLKEILDFVGEKGKTWADLVETKLEKEQESRITSNQFLTNRILKDLGSENGYYVMKNVVLSRLGNKSKDLRSCVSLAQSRLSKVITDEVYRYQNNDNCEAGQLSVILNKVKPRHQAAFNNKVRETMIKHNKAASIESIHSVINLYSSQNNNLSWEWLCTMEEKTCKQCSSNNGRKFRHNQKISNMQCNKCNGRPVPVSEVKL